MSTLGVRARTGCLAAALVSGAVGPLPAAAARTPAEITPRIMAQEGLAIAFTSTVLQSFLLVFNGSSHTTPCRAVSGGGSVRTLSVKRVSPALVRSQVTIYFDSTCKLPYIEATTDLGTTVSESATYLGLHGQTLGALTLTENNTFTFPITLTALGKFRPATGAPGVDFGLLGTLPSGTTGSMFTVAGGLAQTFPKLKLDLASVAPLTLTETVSGSTTGVTFVGHAANLRTGVPGSLSITAPTATSLAIAGGGTRYGSPATKGAAANFVLFPPTPTGWTITDAALAARFKFQVVSDTTRASKAEVTSLSSGAALATIAVDQSGTGTISYAGGSREAVTNWLLAD